MGIALFLTSVATPIASSPLPAIFFWGDSINHRIFPPDDDDDDEVV
jgi:hypothetical protein